MRPTLLEKDTLSLVNLFKFLTVFRAVQVIDTHFVEFYKGFSLVSFLLSEYTKVSVDDRSQVLPLLNTIKFTRSCTCL